MPRPRSPRCPDCGSTGARPIVYGEPSPGLAERAARHEVVLGGCLVGDQDAAWSCRQCGAEFGNRKTPRAVQVRSRDEWLELIRTMLPPPVTISENGELMGGDPVVVVVAVGEDEISVMEAGIKWHGPHEPRLESQPFAKVPLKTPATRVAELIHMAWGKRVSRYRWCPRCHRTVAPEHTLSDEGGICHGCATRVLGRVDARLISEVTLLFGHRYGASPRSVPRRHPIGRRARGHEWSECREDRAFPKTGRAASLVAA